MLNIKKFFWVGAVLILFALFIFQADSVKKFLKYGANDWPQHDPYDGCYWVRKSFVNQKIKAFVQKCGSLNGIMVFSNKDNKIIGEWPGNSLFQFTIQLLEKDPTKEPAAIVTEEFAKLAIAEREKCTIQNADVPLQYFSDGRPMWTEYPHPTPHKTRYKIVPKQEIIQEIINKFDGIPSDPNFDYICGSKYGSHFTANAPYFEFDDRNAAQYLLVGTYGQDTPSIDLNSIRF